jgi:putative transcriptional regulator
MFKMPAQFHPSTELLMDYASGALPEAPALALASHISLCPTCRAEVAQLECVGGALLEQDCTPVAVSSGCKQAVLAALDAPVAEAPKQADPLCRILPAPLRDYVGCSASQIRWEKLTSKVDRLVLDVSAGGKAQLLRIKAGAPMPKHTHKGQEYTLVLQGSFRDSTGLYRRGDIAVCDDSLAHQPIAGEAEDCICLVVTDGRLQLTGLIGRMLSPFIRF